MSILNPKEVHETDSEDEPEELTKLHKLFINGLIELGYDPEVVKTQWFYVGHDESVKGLAYWSEWFGKTPRPPKKYKCVCTHDIKHNHYISDGKDSLVIGSCCKDKFINKRGKTCKRCGEAHRNHKDNYCNVCREIRQQEYLKTHCMTCGKEINKNGTNYKRCFICNRNYQGLFKSK